MRHVHTGLAAMAWLARLRATVTPSWPPRSRRQNVGLRTDNRRPQVHHVPCCGLVHSWRSAPSLGQTPASAPRRRGLAMGWRFSARLPSLGASQHRGYGRGRVHIAAPIDVAELGQLCGNLAQRTLAAPMQLLRRGDRRRIDLHQALASFAFPASCALAIPRGLEFGDQRGLLELRIAPSTCRTSAAVGVSSRKKLGALAGTSSTPS